MQLQRSRRNAEPYPHPGIRLSIQMPSWELHRDAFCNQLSIPQTAQCFSPPPCISSGHPKYRPLRGLGPVTKSTSPPLDAWKLDRSCLSDWLGPSRTLVEL